MTFEADVTSAVVNNTGAVTDSMFVTSRITKDIFAGNPGGATFKWSESATGVNWPNEYPTVNDIAKDKLGLWQKANGFTYNYCQNTFNTNSDITLLKAVSYTHLDVYKRQQTFSGVPFALRNIRRATRTRTAARTL